MIGSVLCHLQDWLWRHCQEEALEKQKTKGVFINIVFGWLAWTKSNKWFCQRPPNRQHELCFDGAVWAKMDWSAGSSELKDFKLLICVFWMLKDSLSWQCFGFFIEITQAETFIWNGHRHKEKENGQRGKKHIQDKARGCSPRSGLEEATRTYPMIVWTKVSSGLCLLGNKRGSSIHCENEYKAGKKTPLCFQVETWGETLQQATQNTPPLIPIYFTLFFFPRNKLLR